MYNKGLVIVLLLSVVGLCWGGCNVNYTADWDSLNTRPLPQWYLDAKFGIFIHWGVYSVPSWAVPGPWTENPNPYAEWYWHSLMTNQTATVNFHNQAYPGMVYQDFAPMFHAELWDPTVWAQTFLNAGAKYVVLTSKHHEGFTLWPSAQSWNWNSMDVGPERDIVGELATAVRAAGIEFGLYYSLYEWFNPLYTGPNPAQYVSEIMLPQMYDIVNSYNPSILWGDGCLDYPSSFWGTPQFMSWLYNESPVCEYVAINDRWGNDTQWKNGGFFTSELEWPSPSKFGDHKWEDCRGMAYSFGYNRMENASTYENATQLIGRLVYTVAQGGNFLLDVGPSADGRIPVNMETTLLAIGSWLQLNGEAIYASVEWRVQSEPLINGTGTVWYTADKNLTAVYAMATEWPGPELQLASVVPSSATVVELFGFTPNPLEWTYGNGIITITIPPITNIMQVQASSVFVFKLTNVK